ncbi:hypothetical protein [Gemmobacter caeni]|nr:hypothetical protein [Gemmobacter caeni]
MSRIMFCATPEGMRRQVRALTRPDGDAPRLLLSGKDVLEAMLALEMGMDVVADARAASTGWRLPEGVEIGFDPDMDGERMSRMREQCEGRARHLSPLAGLQRVSASPDNTAAIAASRPFRVIDPFGPHEPACAGPEAA